MKPRHGIAIAMVFAFVSLMQAQTGFPPFGAFQTGGFDSVNLQNLNVNFMVPVVAHPGRGLSFHYALGYNSLIWAPTAASASWALAPSSGWATEGLGYLAYQGSQPGGCLEYPNLYITQNYAIVDGAGTAHPFPVRTASANNCSFTNVWSGYATDGSGYFIDISTSPAMVRTPDGTKFPFTLSLFHTVGDLSVLVQSVTDANGNELSSASVGTTVPETDWTDTLGQIVLKIVLNPQEWDYSRLAVDGTYQTIAKKRQAFNVKTNFGCTGRTEYTSGSSGVNLVTEIDLPNNQKYLFTYEPTPGFPGYVTGRLQQITLPTGGTITYQYNGANDGIDCTNGTVLGLTRTINDGTTSAVWTYSRDTSAATTTVTAPQLSYDAAANQTVIAFDSKGREISRKTYQGAAIGNPVQTVNTGWATNNTPASRTIILEDGSTQSQVETTFDSNGNLLTSKEHDWGQGAPGPPLRTITLGYLSGSQYTAANIINRVQDETVQDVKGTVTFRKHIDYDQAGFINTQCPGDARQHDTNYDCSYTTRGLPTALTTYTDAATPAGPVTRNFSYDSLGNLVSAQVNSVQQQTWLFSSATQYAFPDSVTIGTGSAPQLTTSATYYVTGEVHTSTDENGQVTTYTYADPGHMDRLTDVQRPDLAHITTAYDDTGLTVTNTSPVQGTDAVKKVVALDGLARPITKTTEDAAGNVYSIVDTQYDVLGRAYKTSSPHTGSTQLSTTNQFDALGRPTITSLPDGAQGSSSYSLNSATVTDPAGKQRKSLSDPLGRVTEVDEPGDASSGTMASGSITVGGTLQSTVVGSTSATSGSGSVTISGYENVIYINNRSYPDKGTVGITVNGHPDSASFAGASTYSTIASALVSNINNDGSAFVYAHCNNSTCSDGVVNLTARSTGSSTNYSLSCSVTESQGSFDCSVSGATLTGGNDASVGILTYDAGTVSLSIDGYNATANYGISPYGSFQALDGSATAIASDLASQIQKQLPATDAPFSIWAVANTGQININWNSVGTAGNVAVNTTSTTSQTSYFSLPSFATCPITTNPQTCSSALTGGADPYPSGLAHPYVTTYQYGVFDNLLQVTQGVQTRTYAYDGMGRTTDVTTPEAGHVSFVYNPFDLPTQRTDARGVITKYGYDSLNRLSTLDYTVDGTGVPATPSVTYQYGTDLTKYNNGRLLTISDGTGSESYSYDQLGRVSQLQKVIGGNTYTMGYGYNLAGELKSLTYPSRRVVQQSFDAIGRLCEIAPQTTGCGTSSTPYATTFGYNPAFQTTGFAYGNGVTAAFNFSPDRLQLTNLSYANATQSLFGLNYFYKRDATNCPNGAAGNNGQIQCTTDLVDSGRNTAYTYDTLGRLATAQSSGSAAYPQWGLSFTFDRYANLTGETNIAGSVFAGPPPVDPATNRISTLQYDASGNLLNDGNNTLVYDAEDRLISSAQGGATSTYNYDAHGMRVQRVSGGVTTAYIFSNGKVIAEYENGAAPESPTREYVYSGTNMLAKIEAGATSYYHRDHLSNRVISDASGNPIGQQGHFPYGQLWYDAGSTSKWKFTTYERDSESQNDYALARYYGSLLGRFSSPDPLSGDASNPQSWNRYSYVAGDPINSIDPSGQAVYGWERLFRSLFLSAAQLATGNWGGCEADGIETDCNLIQHWLALGIAARCPNNNCSPVYDPISGWSQRLRVGPTGGWQIYEPGFSYFNPDNATLGNPDGFTYRNGRWVPYDVHDSSPSYYADPMTVSRAPRDPESVALFDGVGQVVTVNQTPGDSALHRRQEQIQHDMKVVDCFTEHLQDDTLGGSAFGGALDAISLSKALAHTQEGVIGGVIIGTAAGVARCGN